MRNDTIEFKLLFNTKEAPLKEMKALADIAGCGEITFHEGPDRKYYIEDGEDRGAAFAIIEHIQTLLNTN